MDENTVTEKIQADHYKRVILSRLVLDEADPKNYDMVLAELQTLVSEWDTEKVNLLAEAFLNLMELTDDELMQQFQEEDAFIDLGGYSIRGALQNLYLDVLGYVDTLQTSPLPGVTDVQP